MKKKLIDILEKICPNVFLQGTLNENEAFPESFITFWTNYTDDTSFYDDDPKSEVWDFNVIFYSSDPTLVETKSAEIRAALKAEGFIPQGKGNDIPSGTQSHTGWAMEFIYKKF